MDRTVTDSHRSRFRRHRLAVVLAPFLVGLALTAIGCSDDPTPPQDGPETDQVAPSAVSDLTVLSRGAFFVRLEWTAPGDDDTVGVATSYAIRYREGSVFEEAHWNSALTVVTTPQPAPAGSTQSMSIPNLTPQTTYSFALRAFDEAGNASSLSNAVTARTEVDLNTGWWDGALPAETPDDPVRALLASGNQLYVGGEFEMAGGEKAGRVARFDGTTWEPLGQTGLFGSNGPGNSGVRALAEFRGALVAAGNFSRADGAEAGGVAWLDADTWRPLGSGVNGVVEALAVYQNDLYAGGSFTQAGEFAAANLARWDGTRWLPVDGPSQNGAQVSALLVHNGQLFVGGTFAQVGGLTVNHIAAWNGTSWSELAGGMTPPFLATVSALGTFGGNLVAAGRFGLAGQAQANQIARWNGSQWGALGEGFSVVDVELVRAVASFDGELYVSGGMSLSSGPAVNGIARWNGDEWSTLGDGLAGGSGLFGAVGNALANFDGALWVGGNFARAGGRDSRNLARWNGLEAVRDAGPALHGDVP